MPIQQDISIWRGNDAPPVTWAWPDGYAGSTNLQLTIWISGTLLLTAGLGGAIVSDPVARQFNWYPTVAQSRTIPLGRIANYELEDRVGGEVTRWYGAVIGLGGDNLDVGGGNYGATLDLGDPANTFLFPAMW